MPLTRKRIIYKKRNSDTFKVKQNNEFQDSTWTGFDVLSTLDPKVGMKFVNYFDAVLPNWHVLYYFMSFPLYIVLFYSSQNKFY